jgi:hypothetical protein
MISKPDFAQELADRMLAPEPAAAGRRGGRSHPLAAVRAAASADDA